MKKVNGEHKMSATEIKRVEAHTRALARKARFDGCIEAWFDRSNGTVRYYELVGDSWMATDCDDMEFICSESCHADW